LSTISEFEIRRHHPGGTLIACWRQWRGERALRRRGIQFRHTDPDIVAAAYAAMTDHEFDAINARQDWANWRTIPRALSGHVPDRPLRVIDLGCGTGSSTRVLAFYCPVGSSIVGYEMAEALVACARRRSYVHRSGRPADVQFVCQAMTAPFRRPDGSLLPDHSVDLVNASGVVGHHLDRDLVRPLIAELQRVLGNDGVAMLDVGPALPGPMLTSIMASAGFKVLGHYRSWFLDPTGELVFRRSSQKASL
jgi:SAM-dependent methyltransferase